MTRYYYLTKITVWQFRQPGLALERFDMSKDINKGNEIIVKEETNEGILSRRQMLRTTLAVGAGLLLPITFFGCDSKKDATSTSVAPADSPSGSPASSADAAAPDTVKKASQVSMQYQPQPKGEQKCSLCMHFVPESNTCKVVEGAISPDGWCLLWAKMA